MNIQKFKDSGIFWQPYMPEDWTTTRLKFVLTKLNRTRLPESELLICSNSGEVKKRGDSKLGLVANSDDIYQGVKSGDLLIHGMDTWHGAIAVSKYDGMCTPVVHVCDSKQNKKFVSYYLRNMATQKIFKLISNGVRQNTSDFRSWDKLGNIPIALPPIAEQEKIVRFIESKTLNIDTYVAERERELQLLNELKESEIANVITRGLDPNVKMKDSGIPWIGMIPEHWSLRRIKYILTELKEKSEQGTETPLSLSKEDGIIPFSEKKNKTMESASYVGGKLVHKGEIVFNRFKARLFAISNYDGIVSSDYAVYKCHESTCAEYLVTLFGTEMYRDAFNRKASGIGDGFSRLYTEDLFSMYAIFPPIEEQREIFTYIRNRTSQINELISALKTEIEYLKEYKEKLIADCVTGQIKVD